MKLFEVLTTSTGESYVRSYAWCETPEQAVAMFRAGHTGYTVADVTELFSSDSPPFVSRPSDSGFSYLDIGDCSDVPRIQRSAVRYCTLGPMVGGENGGTK